MALLSRLNAFFNSDEVGLPAEPSVAPAVSSEGAFGTRDELAAQDTTIALEDEPVIHVSDYPPIRKDPRPEELRFLQMKSGSLD